MKQTPFQYLKSNIWRVNFDCDKKYQSIYKETFGKALDEMDKYFIQHKLYDAIDFMPVVENVTKKKIFRFIVEEEFGFKASAYFHPTWNYENQYISFLPKNLTKDDFMTHEFIHYLALGKEFISFQENGDMYEVQRVDNNSILTSSGTIRKRNSKYDISPLVGGRQQRHNDFIHEGLTDLLTRKIYPNHTSVYDLYVKMMDYCNELTGQKISFFDFFRGHLPNYVKFIGSKEFDKFDKITTEFEKKYKKNDYILDAQTTKLYLEAEKVLAEGRLMTLANQKGCPAEELVRVVNTILEKSPAKVVYSQFDPYQEYEFLIQQVARIYAQNNNIKDKNQFVDYLLNIAKNRKIENENVIGLHSGDCQIELSKDKILCTFGDLSYDLKSANSVAVRSLENSSEKMRILGLNDGIKQIELTDKQTQETTVINVRVDKNNPQIFEVFDKDMNLIKQFSPEVFAKHKARQEVLYKQQLNMLDNFNHIDQIKEMIVDHSSKTQSVYEVVKLQSKDGQEYFVANTRGASYFYQVTEQGVEEVPVRETKTLEEGKEIENLAYTVPEKSLALELYQSANQKTDEPTPCYILEDGTRFVRYYENDHEVFGELVDAMGKDHLIATSSDTIYNRNNPEIKQLFERLGGQRLGVANPQVQIKDNERGLKKINYGN